MGTTKMYKPILLTLFIYFFLGLTAYGQDSSQSDQDTLNKNTEAITVESDSTQDSLETSEMLRKNNSQIDKINAEQKIITSKIDSIQASINNLPDRRTSDKNWWIYAIIIVLLLLILISTAISFYLYRWRKVLLSQPNAMIPEEWGKYLNNVGKHLKKQESAITENTSKVSNMTETYMTLQSSLDEKDAEIKRLKKGYDKELYRKFLYRFIRVNQTLEEILGDENLSHKDREIVQRLMEDAFLECGVEQIKPEVGEDYRKIDYASENPETIYTKYEDEEFKIAEVISEAYVIKSGEQVEVLVPAEIKVYTTNKKQ